jgi:hypothetical protein
VAQQGVVVRLALAGAVSWLQGASSDGCQRKVLQLSLLALALDEKLYRHRRQKDVNAKEDWL